MTTRRKIDLLLTVLNFLGLVGIALLAIRMGY